MFIVKQNRFDLAEAVLDRVVEDADYPIVTRRDAPDAVVMSLD
jgi:antitoxin YefM